MDAVVLLGALFLVSVLGSVALFLAVKGRKLGASVILGICFFYEVVAYASQQFTIPLVSLTSAALACALLVVAPAMLRRPHRALSLVIDARLWLWLLFTAYALSSIAWTSNYSYGLSKWGALLFRGILFGFLAAIVYRSRDNHPTWPFLVLGLAYGATVLALGYSQPEYPGRLTLPTANPIWVSRAMLLLCTVLFFTSVKLPIRVIGIGIGILCALATQSRGPLLAFLAVMLVAALRWMYGRTRSTAASKGVRVQHLVLGATLLLAFGLATLWTGMLPMDDVRSNRFSSISSVEGIESDTTLQARLDLQRRAIDLFQTAPLIGVGLGGYAAEGRDYPHNVLLEILSELGIIGAALFVAASVASFVAARKSSMHLALLSQAFLYTFFSGDLGSSYEFVALAVAVIGLPGAVVHHHLPVKQATGALFLLE